MQHCGTMFFSHFVLAQKGPLARIWLAAHWDKKLTKAHILEINIESSVEGILQPKVKLALRTSGHLLLGVVRIYSRKTKYLLAECNEAFVKIKMAFRPGVVDLPEGNREAALATITLPEVFHDFENISIPIEVSAPNTLHQSRAEDITLKEDYGSLGLMGDDGFDMGFDDPEMARDATNIDEGFDQSGLLLLDSDLQPPQESQEASKAVEAPDNDNLVNGGLALKDAEEEERTADGTLFESGLFEDAPVAAMLPLELPDERHDQANPELSDDDDTYACDPPSVGLPSSPDSSIGDQEDQPQRASKNLKEPTASTVVTSTPIAGRGGQVPSPSEFFDPNESESFALGPLETSTHRGPERTRSRRKRKLIVDEVKNISGEEMKLQLSDTSDIISTLDLAPPTKRLMHWKESGGVEKLFALPGRSLQSKVHSRLYMRHLTTRPMNNEVFETEDPYPPTIDDLLPMEYFSDNLCSSKRRRLAETPNAKKSEEVQDNENFDDATIELVFPTEQQDEQESSLQNLSTSTVDVGYEPSGPRTSDSSPAKEQEALFRASVAVMEIGNRGNSDTSLEESHNVHPVEPMLPVEPTKQAAKLFQHLPRQSRLLPEDTDQPQSHKRQKMDEEQYMDEEQNVDKELDKELSLDEDDDDYPNPASAGPSEEQMGDESYEQFEERVHSRRAFHMLHVMKPSLICGNEILFSSITKGNLRKQVAQKFYSLLMLKKQQAVELEQSTPYGEIRITKGPRLDSV